MQKRNMLQKWNGCFWAYYLDLADSFFILAQQAGHGGQQFSFLYGLGEVLFHVANYFFTPGAEAESVRDSPPSAR